LNKRIKLSDAPLVTRKLFFCTSPRVLPDFGVCPFAFNFF
jgi:hypothetical protein